ncbi:DUF4848 domain-containing protein [Chitinophaga sp. HK235]|uniref:DUF4848 domain-containing protein n=1 Tax=Chitinophaga sp. HK235 TaxID=2952571 RepID=UPI001BA56F85|nr:DUF4848 domain-containing protein [Chitinophaga sp. HK235]
MRISFITRTCALLMFVFLSCKKDAAIKENEPAEKDNAVKVVDGVLHFSDYQVYVQTMLSINSMSAEQRTAWEKQVGFTSLRSVYDKFNKELDQMEAIRDKDGFFAVKKKYENVAVWNNTGTSYEINCRGILEAGIVNADGMVQVGDQQMHYSRNMITASSTNAQAGSNARKDKDLVIWTRQNNQPLSAGMRTDQQSAYIAYGQNPAANQLYMGEGGIKSAPPIEPGVEAEGYAQVKIYNLLWNGQNRGFCTLRYFAYHRNWLGIMRQVQTISSGFRAPEHYITLSNEGDRVFYSGGTFNNPDAWHKGPNWNEGFSDEHEVVFIASAELKNNPATISFIPPYLNNQLANADISVTENGTANNYWKRYVPFGYLGIPLRVKIHSIGTPPNAKTHTFIIEFN